ncbi:hypothetical protein DV735_g3598, partial [Chaetothyriales sp. CBS 134920]
MLLGTKGGGAKGAEPDETTPIVSGTIEGGYASIIASDSLIAPGTTYQDALDMQRLGKKQEFQRNFAFVSTLGWISIYMATWEFVLVSLALGLWNGGFAGLFWTFLCTVIAYAAVIASLAEMASMAPTAGGQYHWVSEFAPAVCQKFLSYSAGWMSTLGWLASAASGLVVAAALVQSLVEIGNLDFAFPAWHYTLISLGLLGLTVAINTWGAGGLPMLETMSLFWHFLGFLITIIPLWVLCPKNSAQEVFTSVVNNSGYENTGLACMIGQVAVIYCNFGCDSVVHISEEVSNASVVIPKVMWWSYILNAFLGIAMLITMLFCIGTLDQTLDSDVPYLQLFLNSGSPFLAYFLISILFMEAKRHVPFNAVYATAICVAIMLLINLGSSYAFNLILSLSLLALMSTYMLSIGCLVLKRLRNEPLPPARWSLGRWGLPLNVFAFFYSALVLVMACLPVGLPVNMRTANYAPLIWIGVIVLSVFSYFIHGRKHFTPPVAFVEGRRTGSLQSTT